MRSRASRGELAMDPSVGNVGECVGERREM